MRKLSGLLSLCFTMETVCVCVWGGSHHFHHSLLFHLDVSSPLIALKPCWKLTVFQGRPCVLLPVSLIWSSACWRFSSDPERWRLDLTHSTFLWLSPFGLCCLCCIVRLKKSVLFISCKCRFPGIWDTNLHAITKVGLSLMHVWGKIAQITVYMKCMVEYTYYWIPEKFK